MVLNSISPYCRSPSRCWTMKSHAFIPRCVAFYSHYVLHILSFCSSSEIVPSVIGWVFVNMVNLMRWPFTCLTNPNENMRFIGLTLKTYNNSSFFCLGRSARQFSGWPSARTNAPSQFARFWAIIKMLANNVWVRFCHLFKLNHPCRDVNAGSFN